MGLLALSKDNLTDDRMEFKENDYRVFFSPLPDADTELPIAWLDLHLSDVAYEVCGKDSKQRFVECDDGPCVSIRPGMSLRFTTKEMIGVKDNVAGLVVNSAGMAVKGISVAPGKIDPGFPPKPLTLVVINHSKRAIDLMAGGKIATVAFIRTTDSCAVTTSTGWANRSIGGYSKLPWEKFKGRLKDVDVFDFGKWVMVSALGAAFGAGMVLLVQHLLGRTGTN